MDKKIDTLEELPQYTPVDQYAGLRRRRQIRQRLTRVIIAALVVYVIYTNWATNASKHTNLLSIERLRADSSRCTQLRSVPQDPHEYRSRNGRYNDGHAPILIRNATVWTGEPSSGSNLEDIRTGKAYGWIQAEVLLENGLIKHVNEQIADSQLPENVKIIDAKGRQVTSGIIDMHSHTGVDSLPSLDGAEDTNELSSDITPYVRSLDGLNPLDPQIQVIKSGGVTTSLILPGSGNNMGGEAFVIKHAVGKENGRPELSIESLLADPDKTWRYMKMACGENAKNVYGRAGEAGPFSRLGEAWEFRHTFEQATKYKASQDEWCAAADTIGVENMATYLPSDLRWESLSALLRGQVLLNTHCYTIPDLESFTGYTNEFNFSIRAFHHAHSTYLVPEVLKRAYGGRAPAAALFADNMNYKAEAYVASEQAGKILYENGITPVYVSDNPVLNAQHVVFEAAKAYRAGLPYHVALAGVTTASAELLGLGHRIGKIKPGFDADVVLWDSDPLAVGATPLQVFIDGVPQFEDPVELEKPLTSPIKHSVYRDLGNEPTLKSQIAFTGVSKILLPGHEQTLADGGNFVVVDGQIACIGECQSEILSLSAHEIISLQDGHIAPTLTAFGSLLGIEEIASERSTSDGALNDASFSAAIDGLKFQGKNLAAAYRHGVTKAISAPKFGYADHKGISAGFRVGATHALEKGAVFEPEVALHYTLAKGSKAPSISSAVADLRTKLLKAATATKKEETEATPSPEEIALAKVVNGTLPLVIGVHSADTIASLLRLKKEVESTIQAKRDQATELRLVILGGAESHMLAKELSKANVGVILAPLFSYATGWDQRRALTGAPLTNGTAIDVLYAAGVKVAIGVDEDWEARDLFLQAGIVQANSGGRIHGKEALALASTNVYEILGLKEDETMGLREFVVFEGDPLSINNQVRAVADGRGMVSVWLE